VPLPRKSQGTRSKVATVDLHEVVSRMATRSPTRSEADLQSNRIVVLSPVSCGSCAGLA
jgi:hypothetical protein